MENKKIPFSILKEDYESSTKSYGDPHNCPAARAVKRELGIDGTIMFSRIEPLNEFTTLGTLDDSWDHEAYQKLVNGTEFKTFVTLKKK